jgi:hypothetical protein
VTKTLEFIGIQFGNAVATWRKGITGVGERTGASVLEVPKPRPAVGVKRYFCTIICPPS